MHYVDVQSSVIRGIRGRFLLGLLVRKLSGQIRPEWTGLPKKRLLFVICHQLRASAFAFVGQRMI
jgi:hypothetical protein